MLAAGPIPHSPSSRAACGTYLPYASSVQPLLPVGFRRIAAGGLRPANDQLNPASLGIEPGLLGAESNALTTELPRDKGLWQPCS